MWRPGGGGVTLARAVSSTIKNVVLAGLLGLLGSAQMAGELLGSRSLARLAGATAASPAPGGSPHRDARRPPFSTSRVFVQWRVADGTWDAVELDAERLARLRGPGPRRALYRLALARAPELAADPERAPLVAALLAHALGGERPLLTELGVDVDAVRGDVSLQYQRGTARAGGADPIVVEVPEG